MKKVTLLLTFLCVSFYLYPQEITRGELFNLFNSGKKAQEEGRTDDAITIFEKIVRAAPTMKEPYLILGELYAVDRRADNLKKSISYYEKYCELEDDRSLKSNIRNRISGLEIELDSLSENIAIDTIYIDPIVDEEDLSFDDESIESEPIIEEAYIEEVDYAEMKERQIKELLEKGYYHYDKEEYEEAILSFNQVKDIYEYADIYYILCLSYIALRNEKNARKSYTEYYKLDSSKRYAIELAEALKVFDSKKRINWKQYDYQPTRYFFAINYRYSPNFPIKYNTVLYTNSQLNGIGIEYMSGTNYPLKFAVELSYNWIKIKESLYNTGIRHYPSGKESNYIHNGDLKFRGRYLKRYPIFQANNIVGRISGSFAGGFGYISASETPLLDSYNPDSGEEETVSSMLSYIMNNLSYDLSLGILLSSKNIPNGLRIEAIFSGYWQFESDYKFQPYIGIQFGWQFGVPY